MQCQRCTKHATVHLTEIVEGKKIERHLCDECAQKEGITIKTQVPLSELIDNLVSAQQETKELSEMVCPECEMSWQDFRKGGLLGCARDYEVFGEALAKLIARTQDGATEHVGRTPRKRPERVGMQHKLLRLRQDLHRALDEEDYEAAARLRDEIHKHETN